MTDVRPHESTKDVTSRDRPTDPEFREPTDAPDPAEASEVREVPGARESIGVVDNPTTEPVESADRSPRSDDLSEGELSERELGESEANAPAPAYLPRSDVDSHPDSVDATDASDAGFADGRFGAGRPTGAAEAPDADPTSDESTPLAVAEPVDIAADDDTPQPTSPDTLEPVEPTVGATADEPESTMAPAPGDVEQAPVAALWPGNSADGFRERWREIQLRFVDEPKAAAEQADDLVEEAVAALITSLQRVRAELGQWRSTRSEDNSETEHLRVAVQRYREFLDSVVAL